MVRIAHSQVKIGKNANIRDFFKPFVSTQLTAPKRPLNETGLGSDDNPRMSKSPKLTPELPPPAPSKESSSCQGPEPTSGRREPVTPVESSSGLSSLTSIRSDETVEVPTDLLTPSPTPEITQTGQSTADSSFSHASASSSQRIVKHGEVIVTNSDDESDSDGSLIDIDDILKPFKENTKVPLSSPPSKAELPTGENSTRKQPVRSTKNIKSYYGVTGTTTDFKNNAYLDNLLARTKKTSAEDEAYARALKLAEELENRSYELEAAELGQLRTGDLTQEDLVSTVAAGDSENTDKFMQAMQRTEALHSAHEWYFFSTGTPCAADAGMVPLSTDNTHQLSSLLSNSVDREIAFLNGTVGLAASIGDLPEGLLEWILNYSAFEPREDLRQAYLTVLASLNEQFYQGKVDHPLRNGLIQMGASEVAIQTSGQISLVNKPPSRKHGMETGWQVLEHWISLADRAGLLSHLLILALDAAIPARLGVLSKLHAALQSCVDSDLENDLDEDIFHMLLVVYTKVLHPRLRLQLVKMIPPLSTGLCILRKRLALAFFYDDSSYLRKEIRASLPLSEVAEYIRKKPELAIRPGTDYHALAAAMSMLDVGVDDGGRPSEFLDSEAEKNFNKEVDDLSVTIKGMYTRIVDTGASHISRTEAKEIMEALHSRLQFAVRTKPKPRKTMFGDVESGKSQDMITKYVSKAKTEEEITKDI